MYLSVCLLLLLLKNIFYIQSHLSWPNWMIRFCFYLIFLFHLIHLFSYFSLSLSFFHSINSNYHCFGISFLLLFFILFISFHLLFFLLIFSSFSSSVFPVHVIVFLSIESHEVSAVDKIFSIIETHFHHLDDDDDDDDDGVHHL